MGYMDNLMGLFGRYPQSSAQINDRRAGQSRQLEDEYSAAVADPNSGVGLSPAMQAHQEQELGNAIRSQVSSSGAGMSGSGNAAVTKGIVDYRIAQMAQHQKYLDNLRGAMLQASTPQQEQPSLGREVASSFAGRAGQGAANALFGSDSEDETNRSPQGGMGVTATGSDPRGQGPNGPNGRGANNRSSYGV